MDAICWFLPQFLLLKIFRTTEFKSHPTIFCSLIICLEKEILSQGPWSKVFSLSVNKDPSKHARAAKVQRQLKNAKMHKLGRHAGQHLVLMFSNDQKSVSASSRHIEVDQLATERAFHHLINSYSWYMLASPRPMNQSGQRAPWTWLWSLTNKL